jgi:type VI secretion system protein ImpB
MSNSLQNWVGRNRPPRVQITYDVEIGEAVEKRELPMVVGIMADLSGHPSSPPIKLKDRRLVEIDRDNFGVVMADIGPALNLRVANRLTGDGLLPVDLSFSEMSDFHPDNLVRQVAPLAKLLEAREQLRDLLAKLDGNDELGTMLGQIVQDTTELQQLKQDAGVAQNGGTTAHPDANTESAPPDATAPAT